ncbi:MAG: hypothetical protein NTW10_04675 [Bacteroidetes bacterium]|nr:hypothetical protein [Bacteroidota bacterium]
MKKIILLSFVALAVIFSGISLNSSAQNPGKPIGIVQSYIHYQVVIHPDYGVIHNQCPMLVILTDAYNNPVGLPQLYQHGINTYNFYEMGPVAGTRIARLTNSSDDNPNDVCTIVSMVDSKTGIFNNGGNYQFNLSGGYSGDTVLYTISY